MYKFIYTLKKFHDVRDLKRVTNLSAFINLRNNKLHKFSDIRDAI